MNCNKAFISLLVVALHTQALSQNVVIGQYYSNNAIRFDADGTNEGVFCSGGTSRYYGMTRNSAGDLFVAGYLSNNVRRFSSAGVDEGDFLTTGLQGPTDVKFSKDGNLLYVSDQNGDDIRLFSSTGTSLGVFAHVNDPEFMAISSVGDIYVSSQFEGKVSRFSPSGQLISTITGLSSIVDGLAVDSADNLYICNRAANNILKYSSTGASMGEFASTGLNGPLDLAFSPSGDLFVTNFYGGTVSRFDANGNSLGYFASGLSSPSGIAFQAVPEPTSLVATLAGLTALVAKRGRRRLSTL